MKKFLLLAMLPLSLAGCLSFSSSSPSAPKRDTTIVVPPGSTVTCPNGQPGPC